MFSISLFLKIITMQLDIVILKLPKKKKNDKNEKSFVFQKNQKNDEPLKKWKVMKKWHAGQPAIFTYSQCFSQ